MHNPDLPWSVYLVGPPGTAKSWFAKLLGNLYQHYPFKDPFEEINMSEEHSQQRSIRRTFKKFGFQWHSKITELRSEIYDTLKQDPSTFFLFEDVHLMPTTFLEPLSFALQGSFDGVPSDQAVFMFTSNLGFPHKGLSGSSSSGQTSLLAENISGELTIDERSSKARELLDQLSSAEGNYPYITTFYTHLTTVGVFTGAAERAENNDLLHECIRLQLQNINCKPGIRQSKAFFVWTPEAISWYAHYTRTNPKEHSTGTSIFF